MFSFLILETEGNQNYQGGKQIHTLRENKPLLESGTAEDVFKWDWK